VVKGGSQSAFGSRIGSSSDEDRHSLALRMAHGVGRHAEASMLTAPATLSILLLVQATAPSSIRLSEVAYDVVGTEPDGEWVELVNTGSDTVSLDDVRVADEEQLGGGEAVLAFPSGTRLLLLAPTELKVGPTPEALFAGLRAAGYVRVGPPSDSIQDEVVAERLQARAAAKRARDYSKADEIQAEVRAMGIDLDNREMTWRYV